MHPSFRTIRWFRRGGRSAVIGSVACAAMLGSTALALPTAPRQAPRPASAPAAPAPAPVHASRLGVATGAVFWGESPAARDAELADLQHIGVRYVRTVFPWDSIEANSAGTYRWSNADSIVADARAHHLLLIAQIIGAPRWAVPGWKAGQVSDYSPNPALFATFVATFAARYAPLGVTTYELGNEPNHVRPGNPAPNAATYAGVLCATYSAVKRVAPNSTVLTGGLGGTKDGAGAISGPTFVRSLYADHAKGCFDGISYHPYTYPQLAPDNGSRGWTGMLTVRQVMVANGDSAKKIWATEYGAPTNGPSAKRSTSEATQASILTTGYRVFNSYSWAGALCWFDYEDKGANPNVQDDWFGLRRSNGTPKPAYTALAGLGRTAVA
jgi:polysaccharide biosynthesis protein PslG